MTRPHSPCGHILLSTMAFLVLAMILWLAAFGQMAGYGRIEKVSHIRQDRATQSMRALAWGLALLESGLPPTNPYSCRVTPDSGTGRQFVITFQRTSWVERKYTVSVRPATPSDTLLPPAPTKFKHYGWY